MKAVSAGKKIVNELVEECTEIIDKVKIAGMALFERGNKCKSSCTIYFTLNWNSFYNQRWKWYLF